MLSEGGAYAWGIPDMECLMEAGVVLSVVCPTCIDQPRASVMLANCSNDRCPFRVLVVRADARARACTRDG